jgi:hypothetical protein
MNVLSDSVLTKLYGTLWRKQSAICKTGHHLMEASHDHNLLKDGILELLCQGHSPNLNHNLQT